MPDAEPAGIRQDAPPVAAEAEPTQAATEAEPKQAAAESEPKPAEAESASQQTAEAETKGAEVPKSTVEEPKKAEPKKANDSRKRPQNGSGGGQNAKRQKVEIAPGDKGVYFTTLNSGSVDRAKRDLKQLLEEYKVPEDLKSRISKLDFTPCTEATKGMGFLKLLNMEDLLPSKVVSQVLAVQRDNFQSTGIPTCSRLLCRVLPIDHTCKPTMADFRKLAEEVLPLQLGAEAEPTTWALEFKARNSSAIKKEAVLEVLDAIAPKERHKVNLNDPAKCIVVQVHAQWCGLSIVPHWGPLKKYNLNALTTREDVTAPAITVPAEAHRTNASEAAT
ncbi:unnamed protein product [Effrenium voratum]|uniref:THUMP domain-containing protein n=1 Tax=Effrenium voratum TaxID=2562239 RepID=A0AA36JQC2_9DINO|nr:unnamed protein product [Effrenium voratum]CAJ1409811.1 unnamed protein product [Effrenium voratum]CAJ1412971.1 unnamed protein product [Effrenium voratum]